MRLFKRIASPTLRPFDPDRRPKSFLPESVRAIFCARGLQFLPAGAVLGIAENVRMAPLELVADAADHVIAQDTSTVENPAVISQFADAA